MQPPNALSTLITSNPKFAEQLSLAKTYDEASAMAVQAGLTLEHEDWILYQERQRRLHRQLFKTLLHRKLFGGMKSGKNGQNTPSEGELNQ